RTCHTALFVSQTHQLFNSGTMIFVRRGGLINDPFYSFITLFAHLHENNEFSFCVGIGDTSSQEVMNLRLRTVPPPTPHQRLRTGCSARGSPHTLGMGSILDKEERHAGCD